LPSDVTSGGLGEVVRASELIGKAAGLRRKVAQGVSAAGIGPETRGIWVGTHLISPSSSVEEFYKSYFSSLQDKYVVQVGANDGIMCDPLRRFLAQSRDSNTQAILIEPIPFYFERLKALYADYPNISVLNVACGATASSKPLYFIDPEVADQMNGCGPPNNWAHGQGTFDKKVVRYWIDRNRFRGEDYVKKIDFYYASIKSIEVPVVRLADVELWQSHRNLLLAIDVQGFELDVIQGIDWSHPPAYIIFEDDLNKAGPIDDYLRSKGYIHLCGRKEKLYICRLAVGPHGLTEGAAESGS
jgi:FkbM family methyltransferase